MNTENMRLQELLQAWSNKTITIAEEEELARLLNAEEADTAIHQRVKELLDQFQSSGQLPYVDWEQTFETIQSKKQQAPVIAMQSANRRSWWKYAAAALIFGICSSGIYLMLRSDQSEKVSVVDSTDIKVGAPEANYARVKLSNGREIALDSLHNGVLAAEGNTRLVKLADGRVVYQNLTNDDPEKIQYNTLINPRGSKIIDVKLSDGSRVWLNAASSVTYPVTFTGNTRKVSIEGEAYFEVMSDASKPFIVEKNNMYVTVLGTSFNVNAYGDEPAIKVTLLEGAVKLNERNNYQVPALVLKPGQQGIYGSDEIKLQPRVNIDEVMAWKRGSFYFDRTPLSVVLRQFARWYDVEVEYKTRVSDKITLGGEMGKDLSLNEALDGLRELGVNFRIEEKKLIVMP